MLSYYETSRNPDDKVSSRKLRQISILMVRSGELEATDWQSQALPDKNNQYKP